MENFRGPYKLGERCEQQVHRRAEKAREIVEKISVCERDFYLPIFYLHTLRFLRLYLTTLTPFPDPFVQTTKR